MRILIAKEKHGTRYFDATGDKLYSAALKLLTERWEEGYWYEEPEEPENPNIDLEKVPESLKEISTQYLVQYDYDLKYYEQEKDLFDSIKRAVDGKSGKLAWSCLQCRNNGEYESVELEESE